MHAELATTVFQDLGVLHAIFNEIEKYCRSMNMKVDIDYVFSDKGVIILNWET